MPPTAVFQQTESHHFRVEGLSAWGDVLSYTAHQSASAYSRQALSLFTALSELDRDNQRWTQLGAATSILTPQQVDSVERLYAFRRRDEVISFLSDHPFLVELLHEAHAKIQIYFDSYLPMILEVVADPEAIDDRELVLFIQTDLPPVEALASLDRLDEDWWLVASDASRGKLCIHVEYQ